MPEGRSCRPLPWRLARLGERFFRECTPGYYNGQGRPDEWRLTAAYERLEITGIESSSTRFAARVETLEPGRRYRFTVTLNGEGPAGKQHDDVVLKTNLQSAPVLRIPVNTYVREKVFTFPESVFLGNFGISEIQGNPQAARKMAQILMVYRKGTPGFEIKVTSDLAFLKFTSERGPEGDQWGNWVWIDPERAKPGEIKGSIFIETNDPELPKLSVPITGTVLPK